MYRTLIALTLLGSTFAASAAQAQAARDPKGIVGPQNPTAEEAYVKEAIRGAGYSGVNSLMRDSDGVWHARAYKGPADVLVAYDRAGHVTETQQ